VTPEELPAYLARIRQRIEKEGPPRVANAMAKTFLTEVSDKELVRYSHRRGTRTPSPAGDPPAIIGGHLKRSLHLYPAVMTGAASARSKVTPLIVYARIQEMGGTVTPDGHPFLRWKGLGGKFVYARSVTLPKRPYMRPAHRRTIADGSLRRAAIEALKGLMP
jgi:hypothetical protein